MPFREDAQRQEASPSRPSARGSAPVSYTHLDVYKRQVVTDSTKKNLEMRVEAENGATAGKTDLAKRAKACLLYTSLPARKPR